MTRSRRLSTIPRRGGYTALLILTLTAVAAAQPPAQSPARPPAEPAGRWRDLFNGVDLAGWTSTLGDNAAWAVRDGSIISASPGRGEWLHTIEEFADFEIVLEFFLPLGANTGLGLRTSSVGDPSFGGFEIQLNDTADQPPTPRNAGAVFNVAPALVMAVRPNDWNTLRARVVGRRLDAWLNDQRIHDATILPARVHDAARPDAWKRGRISLQDKAGAAIFRAVRIRPIVGPFDPPAVR